MKKSQYTDRLVPEPGYTFVADYPPIPIDAKLFQRNYVFAEVERLIRWEWSVTFGRWGAIVEFPDGYTCYTWPKTGDNPAPAQTKAAEEEATQ